jgi:hypothetical protein
VVAELVEVEASRLVVLVAFPVPVELCGELLQVEPDSSGPGTT